MYAYIVAGQDKNYDASAYAYTVGNLPVQANRKYGWTVVEAYYNGLLNMSKFIIEHGLYLHTRIFFMCTPSRPLIKVFTTDYLDALKLNSWKSLDDNPLFYVHLLEELYYHRLFYQERRIKWEALTEISETEYRQIERCKKQIDLILEN